MVQRNLTITLESDWKAALRATAKLAKAKTYQGAVLNFETLRSSLDSSLKGAGNCCVLLKAAERSRYVNRPGWLIGM